MAYTAEAFSEYQLDRKDKRNKTYVDISLAFIPNPVTNDITIITNERAINNSIKNIIMTLPSEVAFYRDFGSRTNLYLFDMIDDNSAVMLEDEITRAIEFNEPRVSFEYPANETDLLTIYDRNTDIGYSNKDAPEVQALFRSNLGVHVIAKPDQNEYSVTVRYLITGGLKEFNLEVLLTPTR